MSAQIRSAAEETVSLAVSVDCYNCETENDDRYKSIADISESLFPDLVAQTHCLECTPETVAEVKTESYEPYDVDNYHPPVLECLVEKEIRILSVLDHELLELHVSPEVVEVECHEAENDNTEKKHVLRSPLCLCLVSYSITLSTACLIVSVREDEGIDDVNDETSCKNRNHDGYDRKRHEFATCCEKAVSASICSLKCINH